MDLRIPENEFSKKCPGTISGEIRCKTCGVTNELTGVFSDNNLRFNFLPCPSQTLMA
jgi:hypothetical protein